MEGNRKRRHRDSSSPDNLNLFRLMIDPKDQSKIQKTLSRRETQSKRTIINTRTKTFYKFRKLEKNSLTHSLIQHLNHFKAEFYVIDYINPQNIDIKCFKDFDATSNDAQSDLVRINDDSDDERERNHNDYGDSDDEDRRNYGMITNEIYGHLNGDRYFLGNNIDFLNYVYLNESGSCFYLIRNREFFSFMKTIDPDVKISNEKIDIDINISRR
jgi:hypothetical protein